MKIMKKLNIIGQNIKGQVQQVKGKIEVAHGQPIKGNIDKIRGKINVVGADIRNKID